MGLRLLTSADLEHYYAVLHHGYQQTKALPVSFEAVDYKQEDCLKWLNAHPTYGWFDDELTSVLSLRMPWGEEPGPYGVPHIGHFTTHPDFSGKGYGKRLFQQVEQDILQKQLRTPFVTLGTAASHPWLNDMYQRFGFYEIGRKQLAGKQHITIYYRKDL